ncbi:protein of unknown function [Lishizhenia tianjinensis]|uniref:DUF2779 domain-containing protein n=2 Tax=Lishizhenia tianjinensis TaxID=477690 RepID=A0A1I7AIT7_9FLAO|nr:protein of unknown function [Lishizhenia tianjinensis]
MYRLLTKSRFKLGLECPNKLFYTKKPEYANQKLEDPFLEALAQGGFQVEELARMEYPDGHLIEGNDWNYDLLVEQTNELLKLENVVIYEPAFKFNNLFIRVDILIKKGNEIELIEVKAKSYDPLDEHLFVGKRGALVGSWKAYLFDVAFQHYVMQQSNPDWIIKSYLMMANKRKEAKIDGLNQLFRISKDSGNRTGIIKKISSIVEIGESVLGRKDITDIVSAIQNGKHRYLPEMDFLESVEILADFYAKDKKLNYPVSFSCKSCEFQCTDEEKERGLKSGFEECWSEQKGLTKKDFSKPMTFEVWNFRKGKKLFENSDKIFLEDLSEDDVEIKPKAGEISSSERQWIQIEKAVQKDNSIYLLKEELREQMDTWKYPLHFIDFETSTVALPFHKGRKPYEQIAFQFSHHTIDESGEIRHASEYICFEAGKFPNFEFIRALRDNLSNDKGTIFKFATHENSIVNAIYQQLSESNESDKEELQKFIQEISHSKSDSTIKWIGERDMVDLCDIVKKYYYNPLTKGSNSIKQVLPAALNSSSFLKEKYSKPIGQINLDSKNFDSNHIWLDIRGGEVVSPYKKLPSLYEGWTEDQLDSTISELEGVDNGGAALTAYGKLQYTDMNDEERLELKKALLKYCELDTLAMVMIYEHFKEITS